MVENSRAAPGNKGTAKRSNPYAPVLESSPASITLPAVGDVESLVLAAIDRDTNSVREYDIDAAVRLVTLKLVGYTEVVHALLPRLTDDAAILVFGGLARDRPYPGSTTVTTVNGGVKSMVRALVIELAPRRVNAIHPAIVGDSPQWRDMLLEDLSNLFLSIAAVQIAGDLCSSDGPDLRRVGHADLDPFGS